MCFLALAILFSLVPAVRASGFLVFLSVLATLFALALALAAVSHAGFALHKTSTPDFLFVLLINPLESAFVFFQWFPLARVWPQREDSNRSRRLLAIARGLLLSFPFCLIFVTLFASADMQFYNMIEALDDWEFERLIYHTFFSVVFAWLALTILVFFYFSNRALSAVSNPGESGNTWATELIVVLVVINVIFVVYGYFQLGYLFGGIEHIMRTPNLTVAEYARRGFFESATACALVLIILQLFGERLYGLGGTAQRTYKVLAIIQISLALVVIASAFQRIMLYTDSFGLTQDRLYVYVALSWMMLCFVWFVATLVLPWRNRFILGAIGLGYVCFGATVALNPDAYVAAVNVARYQEVGEFDTAYATRLSDDAIPVLAEAVDDFDDVHRKPVLNLIRERVASKEDDAVWTMNYTRFRLISEYGEY